MKAEDLFKLRSVGEVLPHPDGESVLFTVTWPDEDTDENRSVIHVWRDGNHSAFQDGHNQGGIRLSPDGSRLAFLSSEPETPPQVTVVEFPAGEPVRTTDFEDGAKSVEWLDGGRLLVLASQRPPEQRGLEEDEIKRLPRTITKMNYRFNGRGWTHDRPGRLHVVELSNGKVEALSDPSWDCQSYAPSADGKHVLVTAATDDDSDLSGSNQVWLLNTEGPLKPLRLTSSGGAWSAVGWTSEGTPWATGVETLALGFQRPHLLEIASLLPPEVLGPHDVNCTSLLGGAIRPVAVPGALLCPGIRGGSVTIDRYDLSDGSVETVAGGALMTGSFGSLDGSKIFASVTTPTTPAELWEFRTDGSHTVLVSLNDDVLAELDIVQPDVISVPSTDGAEVEAFLIRPPESAGAESPGPGLVYVHGGPTAMYGHGFFDEFQLAAASGYTVIAGNPRGSDGYGEAWAQSVVGRIGTIDWEDIQALADRLAADGAVDPERMGIGGGSYGGFMTAWAIGHTDRFKAALVERSRREFPLVRRHQRHRTLFPPDAPRCNRRVESGIGGTAVSPDLCGQQLNANLDRPL